MLGGIWRDGSYRKSVGGGGVSDCCLTQLTARTSYIRSDDNDVCFVLDQCTDLDFYSAS